MVDRNCNILRYCTSSIFVWTEYILVCWKIIIELDRTCKLILNSWMRLVMLNISLLWVFWQSLLCVNCRKNEGEGSGGGHGHAGSRSY
jgi:hypothetical protein